MILLKYALEFIDGIVYLVVFFIIIVNWNSLVSWENNFQARNNHKYKHVEAALCKCSWIQIGKLPWVWLWGFRAHSVPLNKQKPGLWGQPEPLSWHQADCDLHQAFTPFFFLFFSSIIYQYYTLEFFSSYAFNFWGTVHILFYFMKYLFYFWCFYSKSIFFFFFKNASAELCKNNMIIRFLVYFLKGCLCTRAASAPLQSLSLHFQWNEMYQHWKKPSPI